MEHVMKLELPDLPYDFDALEPHISAKTVEIHYTKHHQGYVNKACELTKATVLEGLPIEDIIAIARGDVTAQPLFNAVAQIWNHDLYWHSMCRQGGGKPSGPLAAQIDHDFGTFEKFCTQFKNSGLGHFGSGYVWLTFDQGALKIQSASDAEIPVEDLSRALLNMDVWEHAYYLDYKNERGHYIGAFLEHLVNWNNAAQRFEALLAA